MLPLITSVDSSSTTGRMDRPKRRITGDGSGNWFACSQQSILSSMDRFVHSVNNMDATVLVPSRLRDMEPVGLKSSPRVPTTLSNADLHSFYLMLNNAKNELLWGPGSVPTTSHSFALREHCNISIERSNSVTSTASELKAHRQCSEDSLGSTASSTMSDTDSEADSMSTESNVIDDHTSHLSVAFRHHLQGLHSILRQLAESADYLSSRYQEEIDDS